MESLVHKCLLLVLVICSTLGRAALVDDAIATEALEWPSMVYNVLDEDEDVFEEEDVGFVERRVLSRRRRRNYISYGALSANRVPCPPRSGRSYYSNNCFKARGPAHPYSRGCSKITRCRR